MCGIVGAVKQKSCLDDLLSGLQRVEYRGYDSAGISVHHQGQIHTIKREGALENLTHALEYRNLTGHTGIGHTRWATHGQPSCANAHPHVSSHVAVVHNGIIENYLHIRRRLEAEGCIFSSDTDSEVIPHLVSHYMARGQSPEAACLSTLKDLQGSYALGVMFRDQPDQIFAARSGSPLVLGRSNDGMYLGSDDMALAGMAPELMYMEDGSWAMLSHDSLALHDDRGRETAPVWVPNSSSSQTDDKARYRYFMHKEIFEQPDAIRETLISTGLQGDQQEVDLSKAQRLTLIGCGSSSYAAHIARYWFEHYAALPVDVEVASEFRYRQPLLGRDDVVIFISQSGETADTLAAMRYAASQGAKVGALVNVLHSSMAREADFVIHTRAGTEIGVASTKAFTCQLCALANLVIATGVRRENISKAEACHLVASLATLPHAIDQLLSQEGEIQALARSLAHSQDIYFIGRGACYPLALEGALKVKEITYLHAEGFGAGELKHGPIALIEDNVPVIVIAPPDVLVDKTLSNMKEVEARGGRCTLITDFTVISQLDDPPAHLLMSVTSPISAPLLYAVALQLLAYHIALCRGTNIDQPRNLAKSVTVE